MNHVDQFIHCLAAGVVLALLGYLVAAYLRQRQMGQKANALFDLEKRLLEKKIDLIPKGEALEDAPWRGPRRFKVAQKIDECPGVCSFYLAPFDGKPLPQFLPGQHLTFELTDPDTNDSMKRCYSLSDKHSPTFYRVTIKEAPLQTPSASKFFHTHVSNGVVLNVLAPGGTFFVDVTDDRPLVLLAGGVGLTPLFSILASICATGVPREVWFFFGVRNSKEHIMKKQLQALARQNQWLRLYVCYSQPLETDTFGEDAKGADYNVKGRVNTDLLKKELPCSNYAFYLCGPPPMMEDLKKGLGEWGVPKKDILYEAFGASSVPTGPADGTGRQVMVKFDRSKKEAQCWSDRKLLEPAQKCKAKISWGCLSGNCGACKTLVLSGKVDYDQPPGFTALEPNYCLCCVARPKTELVLDA
jgi:ferredoxin-NADP reductase